MKQLTVRDFGTLKNGEKAHLYIMENENGISAAVTDYGAALVNLRIPDKNGVMLDVVLGFDDVSGYENGTESVSYTHLDVYKRQGIPVRHHYFRLH